MSESSKEEEGMAFGRLLDAYPLVLVPQRTRRGPSRPGSVDLVHLAGMDTDIPATATHNSAATGTTIDPCSP